REPGRSQHLLNLPQETQADGEVERDALEHMVALEMSQLVCQHRVDLIRREALQQGVEEHDALGFAEAGEVGVALRAALAAGPHKQAAVAKTSFLELSFDARFLGLVLQRFEVEESAHRSAAQE